MAVIMELGAGKKVASQPAMVAGNTFVYCVYVYTYWLSCHTA